MKPSGSHQSLDVNVGVDRVCNRLCLLHLLSFKSLKVGSPCNSSKLKIGHAASPAPSSKVTTTYKLFRKESRKSSRMRFRCQIKKVPLMGSESRQDDAVQLSIPDVLANSQRLTRTILCSAEIVKSLSSMAKSCIIKLSPEAVHFIVPGSEGGPEGMQIWS